MWLDLDRDPHKSSLMSSNSARDIHHRRGRSRKAPLVVILDREEEVMSTYNVVDVKSRAFDLVRREEEARNSGLERLDRGN